MMSKYASTMMSKYASKIEILRLHMKEMSKQYDSEDIQYNFLCDDDIGLYHALVDFFKFNPAKITEIIPHNVRLEIKPQNNYLPTVVVKPGKPVEYYINSQPYYPMYTSPFNRVSMDIDMGELPMPPPRRQGSTHVYPDDYLAADCYQAEYYHQFERDQGPKP